MTGTAIVIIVLEIVIIALLYYFVGHFMDMWGEIGRTIDRMDCSLDTIDYTITEINNMIQDYWDTKNRDD